MKHFCLISILFLCTCALWGKTTPQRGVLPYQLSFSVQQPDPILDLHLNQWAADSLPPVSQLIRKMQGQSYADASVLYAILYHPDYISKLSLDEAEELAITFAYAGKEADLVEAIFKRMEETPLSEEKLLSFYTMAAASLAHNGRYRGKVETAAFTRVKKAAYNPSNQAKEAIWPATVLLIVAADALPEEWPWVMDPDGREVFERRLKNVIKAFDWLKQQETDYIMVDIKSSDLWSITNQGALISLFEQANNFFAYKDDDSFLKSMITTGGFKELIRLGRTGDFETAHALRFSNDGETFYLSHPTPGTDGKGNFVDSANGHRHQVLSLLVQALCISYSTRSGQEASKLIEEFTQSYFEVDADGKFKNYLYVPLIAMRSGRELLENASLEGWKAHEQALQKQLYAKIKKGYKASVVCATVQGACGVAFEWNAVGILFRMIGVGAKIGVKAGGKALMRVLPIRVMLDIAVIDMGVRQAARFTGKGMSKFMAQHGWKLAVAGAVGAGVQSDTRRPLAR